jgi:hypothetical protein
LVMTLHWYFYHCASIRTLKSFPCDMLARLRGFYWSNHVLWMQTVERTSRTKMVAILQGVWFVTWRQRWVRVYRPISSPDVHSAGSTNLWKRLIELETDQLVSSILPMFTCSIASAKVGGWSVILAEVITSLHQPLPASKGLKEVKPPSTTKSRESHVWSNSQTTQVFNSTHTCAKCTQAYISPLIAWSIARKPMLL